MGNKKIALILLFQCYTIFAAAQLYIGGGVGYNFLDMEDREKYKKNKSMILLDTNFQVRHPVIHICGEYYFSKKMAIHFTGQYGSAESAMTTNGIVGINLIKYYYNNYSLNFNYYMIKNLHIGMGINYFRIRKGENFHNDRELVGRFPVLHDDLGICFSTGYEYKNAFINFLYAKSFRSMVKETSSPADRLDPVDIISLQLGYRIKIPQLIHRKKKAGADCPKF